MYSLVNLLLKNSEIVHYFNVKYNPKCIFTSVICRLALHDLRYRDVILRKSTARLTAVLLEYLTQDSRSLTILGDNT